MAGFANVETVLWDDPEFVALEDHVRLLFIYSWTNRLANPAGLYSISERQLCRCWKGGHDAERLAAALEALGEKPLVVYDYDEEFLWVVNRARYANRSPTVMKRIRADYESCPPGQLKGLFYEAYREQFDLKESA